MVLSRNATMSAISAFGHVAAVLDFAHQPHGLVQVPHAAVVEVRVGAGDVEQRVRLEDVLVVRVLGGYRFGCVGVGCLRASCSSVV